MDEKQISELRERIEMKWRLYKGYAEMTEQLYGSP
jgi:hypothetical protein